MHICFYSFFFASEVLAHKSENIYFFFTILLFFSYSTLRYENRYIQEMIYIEFILSFIDVIKFIFEWFMKKKKGKIFEKAIYIDFISNFPYGCKKKIFLNNQVMCRKKTGMRIYFFSHIHLNICIIFLFIQVLIFILYRVFIKNYFLIEDSCRLKIKLFTNSTQHL